MRSVVELPKVTPWPGMVEGYCSGGEQCGPKLPPHQKVLSPIQEVQIQALTFLDKAAVKRVLL